jgi:hypothetical protein
MMTLACFTDDIKLTAHIHASGSRLAQHAEPPHEALRLAQAGAGILRGTEHGPAVAARLRAVEARALANILVIAGEIDRACSVAASAAASSGQLASHRVFQLLASLRAKLLPHAAAREVAEAVEALGARVPAHLLIDTGQARKP